MKLIKMITIILLTTLLLPAADPTAVQEKPLINPLFNTPYYLQQDTTPAQVAIPVKILDGQKPAEISTHIFKVVFDNQENKALLSQFKVALHPATEKHPAYLQISLNDAGRGKRFGTYDLYLYLANQEKQETLKLQVIYPQTQLFPVTPLHIQRTLFFGIPYFQHTSLQTFYLQVKEGRPLHEPFIYQAGSATIGEVQVPGELTFKAPRFKDQGRLAEIPMEIGQPFPLGKTNGHIAIVSPDMEQMDVPFTITTKWNSSLIFFLAMLGILLGYWLRVELAARLERKQNLLQYLQFLKRVRHLRHKGKETQFQKTIQTLEEEVLHKLEELQNSSETLAPEKVKQEFTAIETRLNDAVLLLQKTQDDVTTHAGNLQTLLTYYWKLPIAMVAVVQTKIKELANVFTLLADKEITAAKTNLEQLLQNLEKELRTSYQSWYETLESEWRKLYYKTSPKLPAGLEKTCEQLIDDFVQQCKTSFPDAKTVGQDAVQKILNATNSDFDKAVITMETLLEKVFQSVTETREALTHKLAEDEDQEYLDNIDTARAVLQELEIEPLIQEPTRIMNSVGQKMNNFIQVLVDAVHHLGKRANQENQKEVKQLYLNGQYLEAAKAIRLPDQPPPTREISRDIFLGMKNANPALGEVFDSSAISMPLMQRIQRIQRVTPEKQPFFRFMPALFRTSPASQEVLSDFTVARHMTTIRKDIRKAKRLQSIFTGIGVAVVGWFLFENNFVGTPKDLLSIFVWGFTTDIGVNVFVDKAREIVKK